MADHPQEQEPKLDDIQLRAFAREVLSSMDDQSSQDREQSRQFATDLLFKLALGSEGFADSSAAKLLHLPGLTTADLIDVCIPEVCRRAGDMWMSDELSFVQVTLVGARMQSFCRALTQSWNLRSRSAQMDVLVATAPGEQHIIGIMVLASQLRRAGVSVRLMTGADQGALVNTVARGRFDAVLISAGNSFSLDTAAGLISRVRSVIETPPRLVVGGPIVGLSDPVLGNEKTGADLTTSDFKIALTGLVRGDCSADLLVA